MSGRKIYVDGILVDHLEGTNSNYAFCKCVDGIIRKIFTFTYDSTLSNNKPAYHFEGV